MFGYDSLKTFISGNGDRGLTALVGTHVFVGVWLYRTQWLGGATSPFLDGFVYVYGMACLLVLFKRPIITDSLDRIGGLVGGGSRGEDR
jgi:hypothetical protein